MYLFKNFDKISSITNEQKLNRMIEWYLFIADGLKIEDCWFATKPLIEDKERFNRWKEVQIQGEWHSGDYTYMANYIRDNFDALVTNDIACQALYMVFFRHHAEKSHLCDMPELY